MRIFDVIPALQREILYVKTQIKMADVTPEEIYNKLVKTHTTNLSYILIY